MRTHIFCKDGMDGTDGTDGLDGALVGLGWDGRLLAPAGTGSPEQERHHLLADYCKQGTHGTDELDGVLEGQGWGGQTLAGRRRNRSATMGTRTGVPPWAPEQERHRWLLRGSTLCEMVAGTNFVSAARTRSICFRVVKQYK